MYNIPYSITLYHVPYTILRPQVLETPMYHVHTIYHILYVIDYIYHIIMAPDFWKLLEFLLMIEILHHLIYIHMYYVTTILILLL